MAYGEIRGNVVLDETGCHDSVVVAVNDLGMNLEA